MQSVEIKMKDGWLVLKLVNHLSPKINVNGYGTSLINFNANDLLISNEALLYLKRQLNKRLNEQNPAIDFINVNNIWWGAMKSGIVLQPNELIHIREIPTHNICDNIIDDEVIKIIKNYEKTI